MDETSDDVRRSAEAIIGADRPSHAPPVEPAPNPASLAGLYLYPYRKTILKVGVPSFVILGIAAIVQAIVSGGSSHDSTRATKMCSSVDLPGALMSVDSTTATRLRNTLDATGHAGAAALASAPPNEFVALCTIKNSNAGGSTVTVAVLPTGSVIHLFP